MVMDLIEEAIHMAIHTPYCNEQEALEREDAGSSTRVHDTLVRAAVREINSLLDLQEKRMKRRG